MKTELDKPKSRKRKTKTTKTQWNRAAKKMARSPNFTQAFADAKTKVKK